MSSQPLQVTHFLPANIEQTPRLPAPAPGEHDYCQGFLSQLQNKTTKLLLWKVLLPQQRDAKCFPYIEYQYNKYIRVNGCCTSPAKSSSCPPQSCLLSVSVREKRKSDWRDAGNSEAEEAADMVRLSNLLVLSASGLGLFVDEGIATGESTTWTSSSTTDEEDEDADDR